MNIIAAPLYGVSVAVLFAIALALVHGALDGFIALLSLAAGGVVAIFALWRDRHTSGGWKRPRFWGWAGIALFALFALRAFLWLIFRDGDAIKVLSPNNLGDLSLHLTYIQYFASGATFWPDNPIHALSKLTYPIGVDLLNSLLVLRGCDIIRGLIWVGLAGSALTAAALWRWGGSFVLFGFLCNGGLLGFELFWRWELHDYQSEAAWPDGFPAIGWKSIPLALFVTQRGFLFALPAGLLLLESWRNRFFEDGRKPHLPLWGELLLYASLPIFHLHTFLFLSLLLGCWLLIHRAARGEIAWLLALAFVPASALVFLVTGGFQGASMIGFHPGWMQNEQNFFVFWGLNFGLLPLIVLALAVVLLWRWEKAWPAAIVLPALGIFVLCCVVRFAPWEWDNTKLMIWCYLTILPALWTHLLMRTPAFIRWAICFLLFFSGFVSLLGGLDRRHQGYAIAARSELDHLHNSLRQLPINRRFIGHPTYNHPLLLHGRPMAMGYSGHVWSHGLPYAGLVKDVETILRGQPEWKRVAEKLGVRYLYWGREERENYPDSAAPWKEEARRVAAGEWGEIYDLSAPAPLGTGAGSGTPNSQR